MSLILLYLLVMNIIGEFRVPMSCGMGLTLNSCFPTGRWLTLTFLQGLDQEMTKISFQSYLKYLCSVGLRDIIYHVNARANSRFVTCVLLRWCVFKTDGM